MAEDRAEQVELIRDQSEANLQDALAGQVGFNGMPRAEADELLERTAEAIRNARTPLGTSVVNDMLSKAVGETFPACILSLRNAGCLGTEDSDPDELMLFWTRALAGSVDLVTGRIPESARSPELALLASFPDLNLISQLETHLAVAWRNSEDGRRVFESFARWETDAPHPKLSVLEIMRGIRDGEDLREEPLEGMLSLIHSPRLEEGPREVEASTQAEPRDEALEEAQDVPETAATTLRDPETLAEEKAKAFGDAVQMMRFCIGTESNSPRSKAPSSAASQSNVSPSVASAPVLPPLALR